MWILAAVEARLKTEYPQNDNHAAVKSTDNRGRGAMFNFGFAGLNAGGMPCSVDPLRPAPLRRVVLGPLAWDSPKPDKSIGE